MVIIVRYEVGESVKYIVVFLAIQKHPNLINHEENKNHITLAN